MDRPRFVIAAPKSGSGKTMVTCGLLKALTARGVKVSSFKCGPDYIDPRFHEKVLGTRSGNLDLFFMGPDLLRERFLKNGEGTELSVVEGVMGYYDGMSISSTEGSTYAIAKAIEAPVILVIDARGQSVSALAVLRGFLDFVPDSGVKGVIFNEMSPHVFASLKEKVEAMGIKALGYVPRREDLVVESRHLGLVSPEELADLDDRLGALAALLEETVDIDGLLALAGSAPALDAGPAPTFPQFPGTRIAIAQDEAFSFLYRDNVSLLEDMGAQVVYFSPIHDSSLPEGTQGMILPGGYPELFAQELSENRSMRQSVSHALSSGMPCLAECGGFLYLHQELQDMEGRYWPMVGTIHARAYRTQKLGRFGYIELSSRGDSPLLRPGESLKAHEFHYYESESCGSAMEAKKPLTGRSWDCIHEEGGLVAGFPHIYYRSAPDLLARWLRLCAGKERR